MTVNPSQVQTLGQNGESISPALITLLGQLADGVGGGTLLSGWTQTGADVDADDNNLDLGTGNLNAAAVTAVSVTTTAACNIGTDLNHDGTKVGFYGHAPATKPVVPLTTPTVQQLITALIAIGLIAQSD